MVPDVRPTKMPRMQPPSRLHGLLDVPEESGVSRLVRPPGSVKMVVRALGIVLPVLVLLLLFMPWQQAALGTGRVIALAPAERRQVLDAPISGRVSAWHVREGQHVKAGDVLLELRDNDPLYLDRLEDSEAVVQRQIETLQDNVDAYTTKIEAAQRAMELEVAQYGAKLAGLERKRVGLQAEVDVESLQAERTATLVTEGIVSQREADIARLKRDKASAEFGALDREIAAARQAQGKARAQGTSKVASAQAEREAARAKLDDLRRKLLELQAKVSRQSAQQVIAPRDGVVLELRGGPVSEQVKAGEPLLTLVPDAAERAVELWIDGNDMPLIHDGEEVRLLFEGWPALQVIGFPGAGAGTFAGTLAYVDAADDGKGRFRIVVRPDPDGAPWPDAARLRQGVRAKGWVLLGRVPLGFELWRLIHGFPPLPPSIDKGGTTLPSSKKPRSPLELK